MYRTMQRQHVANIRAEHHTLIHTYIHTYIHTCTGQWKRQHVANIRSEWHVGAASQPTAAATVGYDVAAQFGSTAVSGNVVRGACVYIHTYMPYICIYVHTCHMKPTAAATVGYDVATQFGSTAIPVTS
jgi:putative cofactor-binding repeat protein